MSASHPLDTEGSIGSLVENFLDTAHSLTSFAETPSPFGFTAEFAYELDQAVSAFLDHHQLPPSDFEAIQQDVINSLADHLSDDSGEYPTLFDGDGNASLSDVMSLLDQHCSTNDPSVSFVDPGYDPGAD